MIAVDRLTYRYPGASVDALDGLSLRVRPGSLFGLLGPNGSGKTTLVSILAGVLPAPHTVVAVDGHDVARQPRELDGARALVPQEYAFYPRLSVLENLRFFAGVQSIAREHCAERIDEVLVISGLSDARRRRAEHLSGGMKRRLNFAIGLLNRPRLLLLDEPTVGIDPQSRAFILDSVRRINAQGTTVIYTSHYMEEVEALCDEIAVLDRGKLLVQGSLTELLSAERGHGLVCTFSKPPSDAQRAALGSVAGARVDERGLTLAECGTDDVARVLELCRARGIELARVKYGYGNLEELFLHLTKRSLRDD